MSASYVPARAMFIFAHPDDIEFSSAGTAALWAQQGCAVTYVLITDGSVGTDDESLTQAELALIRRREQEEAAAVVGAQVEFLGYPDGRLEATLELRKELVRLIRTHRPNVVICGDPTVYYAGDGYINHPDHRAAAVAAFDAIYPSADSPLLYPDLYEEGLRTHKINYVYVTNREKANLYIDISDTIDLKIEALMKHASQFVNFDPSQRVREWMQNLGKRVGFAYAEAFMKITLREDESGGIG